MNRRPRRRKPTPAAPLPQRLGIDPVHLKFPAAGNPGSTQGGGNPTGTGNPARTGDPTGTEDPTPGDPAAHTSTSARAHLLTRLSSAAPGTVDRMLRDGEFRTADGSPLAPDAPYVPGLDIWFHRDLPPEVPVPYDIPVLHRDDRILVADKPHFLATTPRGSHITETALARLRHGLGIPALSPAHRLDRLTAGLVLFVVDPAARGAYQNLFRDRRVRKEYEALAAYDPSVAGTLPRTVRSRIEKVPGIVAAREIPGEPNSESRIELLGHRGDLARYRLTPHTGRTHQLRVHMNAVGLPILGDPYFPELTDPAPDDFTRPLQLLARTLEFTDPFTGAQHRFESRRTLQAWQDPEGWAA